MCACVFVRMCVQRWGRVIAGALGNAQIVLKLSPKAIKLDLNKDTVLLTCFIFVYPLRSFNMQVY